MRWIAGASGPPAGGYDADVVILALNRPDETVAAIGSALSQRGVSRHVLVVDQGSRQAALDEIARAVAGRSDVTLIALERNYGVAGGRNQGAALGHGRIIATLDNDAEFASVETLRDMVTALDGDASLGVIGCRIVQYDGGADDLTSWGYPIGMLPHAGKSFDANTFVGAGHAIRRAAWQQAGGYDAALFFCWEEFDFALRAMARGWRIRYRGDLVVRHKVSRENRVTWSGERWFYHVRNRLYISRKFGAGWCGLLPRMAGYLLKGMRNRLFTVTVHGIFAAIRMPIDVQRLPAPAGSVVQSFRGSWITRLRREVWAPLRGR
jgi:GT2 family glycosyltransferase